MPILKKREYFFLAISTFKKNYLNFFSEQNYLFFSKFIIMTHLEIICPNEHTKHEQWTFSTSFLTGKYSRKNIYLLRKDDESFNNKIAYDELEEILSSCEKTTGNFLCTRFVLLLIISFAITAVVLLTMAIYMTIKKKEKNSIIYIYVFAIAIGVFCNLLLFLLYMLITYIYEKQINLYLGQRKIVETFETRNLFWRANGTKVTLNNIYNNKCDQECEDLVSKLRKDESKNLLLH